MCALAARPLNCLVRHAISLSPFASGNSRSGRRLRVAGASAGLLLLLAGWARPAAAQTPAPLVVFLPGTQTEPITGFVQPEGVAIDSSGNLYVTDANAYNSPSYLYKETLSGGIYSQTLISNNFVTAWAVAIDSSGNLYVADTNDGNGSAPVYKFAKSGNSYTQTQIGTFSFPDGVAVDSSGNVYVANWDASGGLYKLTKNGNSYTESQIGIGLTYISGVGVDSSGNVYATSWSATSTSGTLYKEALSNGNYTQSIISINFVTPEAVAVDPNGNLYVADDDFPGENAYEGDGKVYKETLSSGSYTQSTLISGLFAPEDLAFDANGNLYLAVITSVNSGEFATAGSIYKEDYADPPTLSFGSVNVGSTSSAQTVTVENFGNATLDFEIPSSGDNPSIAPGFTLASDSGSECPLITPESTGGTLEPGVSCTLPVTFAPQATGSYNGSTLVITDNNLNNNTSPYATQTITLDGTGTGTDKASYYTVTGPGSATAGTQFSITVKAYDALGNLDTSYAGTVHFTSSDPNATLPANSTLPGGAGTFNVTLKTTGTQTITATDITNSTVTGSVTSAVSASTATHLGISAPSTATAGTSFGITVYAYDAYGNFASGYNGTVHFTSTDGAATLPANTALSSGEGSFTATLRTGGAQTITATDTGNSSITGTSNAITVIPTATLAISKSHTGSFTQGSTGTWTLVVSNTAATGSTSGAVTVSDTLPAGYTLAFYTSTGSLFACSGTGTVTCNGTPGIAAGGSNTITLTVNVPANSPTSVSNTASTWGGGDTVHNSSATAAMSNTDTVTVVQVPASVSIVAGNNQSATVGTGFASPLTVQVNDAGGVAISGASVTFTTLDNGAGGVFSNSSSTITGSTNSFGQIAEPFTANPTVGTYTVTAQAGSASAAFSLANIAGPAAIIFEANGGNQSAILGQSFATPLTVLVTDIYGNAVSGAVVSFSAPPSGASATLSSSGSCATAANGLCSVTATANSATGSYSVAASAAGVIGSVNFALTNNPPPVYVVNTAADDATGTASNCTSSPEGTCTLRDALAAASNAGGATITFASSAFPAPAGATITLGSAGTLTIPSNTTIQGLTTGSGASLTNLVTVSGNGAVQVFYVASGVTASMSGLTIANGLDTSNTIGGGGVYNAGTLILDSCVVTDNQQTGIGFGAGIGNAPGASLTINRCTISNNLGGAGGGYPGQGGGLYNLGTAMITNSTFSGNTAAGDNGGPGDGGAIYNGNSGILTLINSTLVGNGVTDPFNRGSAQGGAIFNRDVLVVENSTIFGNSETGSGAGDAGGGISSEAGGSSSCSLSNTILAGNTAAGGDPDGVGQFTDGGDNLIGNGAGVSGITNGVNGDLVGSSASPLSPNLAALGNYGGPTQTMIPLPGSPAICAGSSSLVPNGTTTDQRGAAYGAGGYCASGSVDAGAVQTDYALSFSGEPSPIAPATQIVPGTNFQAAVTLDESGTPFTGAAVSIPLSLVSSPAGATLSNGTQSTSAGVATYSTLQVNEAGTGDTLTANLTLNAGLAPALALAAASSGFDVGPAATTTAASNASATYSSSSQGVTLSATVTSTTTVNGGTVTFTLFSAATQIGSPTSSAAVTNGTASAVYTLPAGTPAGTYTVVAQFSGNGDFSPSSDSTHQLTVSTASTTTTASNAITTYSASPQSVTLSATVTSPAGVVNSGAVRFSVYNGATLIGLLTQANVSNGTASASYILPAGTPAGTYTMDAEYFPGADFEASSDNTHQLTVSTAATTTTASNASATYNATSQVVTLSAAVTSPAGVVNSGAVRFSVYNGATLIGLLTQANVSNGTASASYILPAGTPAGTYTIDAEYFPGADFASSSDNTHQLTIAQAATATTAINASAIYNPGGQNLILQATVNSAGGAVNGGTVTFTVLQGATPIGTPTAGAVSSGAASVSYALPGTAAAGTYTIQAVYSGAIGAFAGSSDSAHTVTINPIPNFVVNNTGDSGAGAGDCPANPTGSGPGACTLRDALAASAAATGGNITFDATVFASANTAAQNTITLGSSGTLNIPSNTTISGATSGSGATLSNLVTVSGNNAYSVFNVASGVTGTAIANLVIANGNAEGGGIFNAGGLNLTGCTFSANSMPTGSEGGAIWNGGSLAVGNSTFTGNGLVSGGTGGFGGAIYNALDGTLTVQDSTFYNNDSGSQGGAIWNGGAMTLTGDTFSANSALYAGGAILNGGTATVGNSLFAGDTGGECGGIGCSATDAFVRISGSNSGSGSITIAFSDSLGNQYSQTATYGPFSTASSIASAFGAYFSENVPNVAAQAFGSVIEFQLENGASFGTFTITNPSTFSISPVNEPLILSGNGNITGPAGILTPLGSYGGPTQTMIPLPGSAAICSAESSLVASGVTTDQRGFAIGAGGYCPSGSVDAGAVQTDYAVSFTTQPSPIAPASSILANTNFLAAVTLDESGAPFTAAYASIPLTLTGNGALTGGTASTASGVASYSALQVSAAGSNDELTASLTLNGSLTPSLAIAATSSRFSVSQATPALSFAPAPAAQTYGAAISSASLDAAASYSTSNVAGTFAYTTNVNGVPVTLVAGTTVLPAGGYTVTATFTPADSSTYASTSATASYTVNPAALSITASSGSMTYGGTVPSITASYAGFVNNDSSASLTTQPVCSTTATSHSAAGSYPSSCSGAVDANYTISYTAGSVTVGKVALTITASSGSMIYGGTAPNITAGYAGFVNSDSSASLTTQPVCSTTATSHSAVGSYPSSCSGAVDANYTISYTAGSVTVGGAALTIAANNSTRLYGTANPAFSGTVTGQQNGDTFTESFTTAAILASPAGSYAIVPSVTGANLSDYTQSIVNGSLTVTQAPSTTTISLSSATLTPGQNETITATVASSTTGTPTGTVSFYDGTTLLNTATLANGTASYATALLAPGVTHAISAVYSGDTNFLSSSSGAPAVVIVASLDFTLTLSGPSSLTMVPGSSINFQFNVAPDFGDYAGPVNFAMTGLPAGYTVSFSPSSIPANGGPQTVTVTIQAPAATATLHRPGSPSGNRPFAPIALGFLLLLGAGSVRKRSRAVRRFLCVLMLLGAGAAATLFSACGGHPGFFTQAPQSYNLTLTATSASISHSANVNLNVQ
jgi:large repetitive protein